MQNRYFGDIGDFGKYGMLRTIINSGLKLGINWYLYPDESNNDDGKHTSYLQKDKNRLEICDAELYSFLKEANIKSLQGLSRNIRTIEESELLQNTAFYSDMLDYKDEHSCIKRVELRKVWHENSILTLKEAEVIFCDPDNGFEVMSVSPTSKRGGKFILYKEMQKQYNDGKSMVVYNHGPLWFKKGEMVPYIEGICSKIKEHLGNDVVIACLRWETTAKRFYFWLIRPEHKELLMSCLDTLSNEPWGKHFRLVALY